MRATTLLALPARGFIKRINVQQSGVCSFMNYPNRWIIQQCLQSGTIYPCQSSRSSSFEEAVSPVGFQGARGMKRWKKTRISSSLEVLEYLWLGNYPLERGQVFIERECSLIVVIVATSAGERDLLQPSLDKFAAEPLLFLDDSFAWFSLITPFFLPLFLLRRDFARFSYSNRRKGTRIEELDRIRFLFTSLVQ